MFLKKLYTKKLRVHGREGRDLQFILILSLYKYSEACGQRKLWYSKFTKRTTEYSLFILKLYRMSTTIVVTILFRTLWLIDYTVHIKRIRFTGNSLSCISRRSSFHKNVHVSYAMRTLNCNTKIITPSPRQKLHSFHRAD